MPKNIFLESSIYHLLITANKMIMETEILQERWLDFINSLHFSGKTKKIIVAQWELDNKKGIIELDFSNANYYKKGNKIDTKQIRLQNNITFSENAKLLINYFLGIVNE